MLLQDRERNKRLYILEIYSSIIKESIFIQQKESIFIQQILFTFVWFSLRRPRKNHRIITFLQFSLFDMKETVIPLRHSTSTDMLETSSVGFPQWLCS